ncbi:hypothetical protein D3C71_1682510 [compost metagenome]
MEFFSNNWNGNKVIPAGNCFFVDDRDPIAGVDEGKQRMSVIHLDFDVRNDVVLFKNEIEHISGTESFIG